MKIGTAKVLMKEAMAVEEKIKGMQKEKKWNSEWLPGRDRLLVSLWIRRLMPDGGGTLQELSKLFGVEIGIMQNYLGIMLELKMVRVVDNLFLPCGEPGKYVMSEPEQDFDLKREKATFVSKTK